MLDLAGNPKDRFSDDTAHMSIVSRKPVFRAYDQVGHKPGHVKTQD